MTAMTPTVAELEAGLSAMLTLKAPGVSTSKIKTLTDLCQTNVKDESLIVQKFYTHFKKAPPTHKLGVLYLIDSVVRKWVEQAKQQHQGISSTAQDGTFAAGVFRVTEILPALMDNILQTAPPDQKDRIKKLVDIWERAQTFPPKYIEKFRQQLKAAPQTAGAAAPSTTPPGSPPPGLPGMPRMPGLSGGQAASASSAPSNNIMEMLASIAKQSAAPVPSAPATPATSAGPVATSIPTVPGSTTQAGHYAGIGAVGAAGYPHGASSYPHQQTPAPAQTPTLPTSLAGFPPQSMPGLSVPPPSSLPPGFPSAMPGAMAAFMPGAASGVLPAPSAPGGTPGLPAAGVPAPPGGGSGNLNNQVMLIKTLIDQGLQPEQISMILQIQNMGGAGGQAGQAGHAAHAAHAAQVSQGFPQLPVQGQTGGWPAGGGMHDPPREQSDDRHRYRSRSRSRSPNRWSGRDSRGGYDKYGRDRGSHEMDRDRGRDSYRHRSPVGRRSPNGMSHDHDQRGPRNVHYDRSMQEGRIKVMSRTLFVGGVNCSQSELQDVFARVGPVQSVIINKDKRHAFVKMVTRDLAVEAKKAMGEFKSSGLQLRTRWGVGFGPRDCCDYEVGVSIIPISRLTEADKKWLLTAQYGGSGGAPIETGLVVEEPDIEIGAGVSSKAISRRIQTDKGGAHGPKSTRRDDDQPGAAPSRSDRRRDPRREDNDRPPSREHSSMNPNLIPAGFAYGVGQMPTYPGYSYSGSS